MVGIDIVPSGDHIYPGTRGNRKHAGPPRPFALRPQIGEYLDVFAFSRLTIKFPAMAAVIASLNKRNFFTEGFDFSEMENANKKVLRLADHHRTIKGAPIFALVGSINHQERRMNNTRFLLPYGGYIKYHPALMYNPNPVRRHRQSRVMPIVKEIKVAIHRMFVAARAFDKHVMDKFVNSPAWKVLWESPHNEWARPHDPIRNSVIQRAVKRLPPFQDRYKPLRRMKQWPHR